MVKVENRMLSVFLLSSIIIASILAKNSHRLLASIAILIPFLLHEVFLAGIGGEYFTLDQAQLYYIGSMALSMLTIGLLGLIKNILKTPKHAQLVVHLQIIALLFMVVNFSGFWIWYAYLPVGTYNTICVILALAEVVRLIIQTDGDKKDGIDNHFYGWNGDDNKRGMGGSGKRL